MDYSSLKTNIASYLGRTNLTTIIPNFITLAEAQLNRKITLESEATTAELSLSSDTNLVALPNDFSSLKGNPYLQVSSGYLKPLNLSTLSQQNEKWDGYALGQPESFIILGSNLRISPKPDGDYTLVLPYFKRLTALSDSNTTNNLSVEHPDCYLFASLVQAYIYIDDKNNQVKYENLLLKAISEIHNKEAQSQASTNN